MSLRLRALRIRVTTDDDTFGCDLSFGDGLCVLRAENSRGKSTAVKSILFALGLERMIAPRSAGALTSALTQRLIDERTGLEAEVRESRVDLEIANAAGDVLTVRRWPKHPHLGQDLVRVFDGPAITSPVAPQHRDHYVGSGGSAGVGSAQGRIGFHRRLAEFMGWDMPVLVTSEGAESRLYVEQVFPLLFVEQRRGWGGIQAQMPAFAGVPEIRRRALEFLLALDAQNARLVREQLRAEERDLTARWRQAVRDFAASVRGDRLLVRGLPAAPETSWPPEPSPVLVFTDGDQWTPLPEALMAARALHASLAAAEQAPPRPGSDERQAEALETAEGALDDVRLAATALRREVASDRRGLDALDDRLVALEEDLRLNREAARLERLGSEDPALGRLHEDCPTCHRPLPESLLPGTADAPTLTAEQTVQYIAQQRELFTAMRDDAAGALAAKEERLRAYNERAAELRREIKALREALAAPGSRPNPATIIERLRLEDRIERLVGADEAFAHLLDELGHLASRLRDVRAGLGRLPANALSGHDTAKLEALQRSFLDQLGEYEFGSFDEGGLRIGRDDYLPRRDDFDLQADISASDSIRVIWAYLLGLLELSRDHATHHPGLLVFDEPRQQSAKEVSFGALLARASESRRHGEQVIFATSEATGSLRAMVAGLDCETEVIEGYVLKPL